MKIQAHVEHSSTISLYSGPNFTQGMTELKNLFTTSIGTLNQNFAEEKMIKTAPNLNLQNAKHVFATSSILKIQIGSVEIIKRNFDEDKLNLFALFRTLTTRKGTHSRVTLEMPSESLANCRYGPQVSNVRLTEEFGYRIRIQTARGGPIWSDNAMSSQRSPASFLLPLLPKIQRTRRLKAVIRVTHVSELLGTRLGLLASICQSTTRNQVMTRL